MLQCAVLQNPGPLGRTSAWLQGAVSAEGHSKVLQITKPVRSGDPAKMWAVGRSSVLCPGRRVLFLRKASGPRVGVGGTIRSAWAKEVAAEVPAARLSRSSRGRCGCRHRPPVSRPRASACHPAPRARPCPQPRLNGSAAVSAPDPHSGSSGRPGQGEELSGLEAEHA